TARRHYPKANHLHVRHTALGTGSAGGEPLTPTGASMPQTMLGLLALVLASFVSFNQQRLTQQSYRNAIRDEVEIAASGTAQHVVEMIAARSYDEASTPVRVFQAGGVPTGTSLFTAGANFAVDRGGAGCNLMDPASTPECD